MKVVVIMWIIIIIEVKYYISINDNDDIISIINVCV